MTRRLVVLTDPAKPVFGHDAERALRLLDGAAARGWPVICVGREELREPARRSAPQCNFRRYDGPTAAQSTSATFEALVTLDLDVELGLDDVLICSTPTPEVLTSFELFLIEKARQGACPTFFSLIFETGGHAHLSGERRGVAAVLDSFKDAGLMGRSAVFAVETKRLQYSLAQVGHDLPVLAPPLAMAADPATKVVGTDGARPFLISVLGEAREEKGFHWVPDILERLFAQLEGQDYPPAKVIVQVSSDTSNDTALIRDARRRLRRLSETRPSLVLEGYLSSEDYGETVRETDIALLPYASGSYRERGSGVAVEVLANGGAVVCTAGTDIAAEFESDAIQEAEEGDVEAFAAHLANLIAQGRRGADKLDAERGFLDPKAFLSALIDLSESAPPPSGRRADGNMLAVVSEEVDVSGAYARCLRSIAAGKSLNAWICRRNSDGFSITLAPLGGQGGAIEVRDDRGRRGSAPREWPHQAADENDDGFEGRLERLTRWLEPECTLIIRGANDSVATGSRFATLEPPRILCLRGDAGWCVAFHSGESSPGSQPIASRVVAPFYVPTAEFDQDRDGSDLSLAGLLTPTCETLSAQHALCSIKASGAHRLGLAFELDGADIVEGWDEIQRLLAARSGDEFHILLCGTRAEWETAAELLGREANGAAAAAVQVRRGRDLWWRRAKVVIVPVSRRGVLNPIVSQVMGSGQCFSLMFPAADPAETQMADEAWFRQDDTPFDVDRLSSDVGLRRRRGRDGRDIYERLFARTKFLAALDESRVEPECDEGESSPAPGHVEYEFPEIGEPCGGPVRIEINAPCATPEMPTAAFVGDWTEGGGRRRSPGPGPGGILTWSDPAGAGDVVLGLVERQGSTTENERDVTMHLNGRLARQEPGAGGLHLLSAPTPPDAAQALLCVEIGTSEATGGSVKCGAGDLAVHQLWRVTREFARDNIAAAPTGVGDAVRRCVLKLAAAESEHRFGVRGVAREHRFGEWAEPEAEHCWIAGRCAGVGFKLDRRAPPGRLRLRGHALPMITLLLPRLEIRLNGRRVAARRLLRPGVDVDVALPSAVRESGVAMLEIECSRAAKPTGSDGRRLSVAIRSIEFS